MKTKLLLWAPLVSLLLACNPNQNNEKIFHSLNSSKTGIDFENTLIENDSMNYFTYAYMYMGGGVSAGDINNDGLDDLFFTGNMVTNGLYLNKGGLKFEDISAQAGVQGSTKWYTGVTMADVNGDGWLDIYVSVAGKYGDKANELYINQKDGTFIEMAKEYGLADQANSVQASFFDFDKDGDLDVYIANYPIARFDTPTNIYAFKQKYGEEHERDRLMENVDGKFIDITEKAGITNYGLSLSVTVADVNDDSWPDIYVSNDFATPDFFYMNNGDGTFSNKVRETTSQTAFYGMGVDIADFNNDALLDIMQVDMMAKDNRRAKANMASMNPALFWGTVNAGFHYQYMHNMLQENNGNLVDGNLPSFSNMSKFADVSSTDWSWGPLFADLDNDGLKDLFISNGTRREINNRDYFNRVGKDISDGTALEKSLAIPSERIDNFVFKNPGSYPFIKANKKWGIEFPGFSNGGVYVDLDNDGDLEIVTNNIDDPISIFENTSSEQNNYVQLSFKGEGQNVFGLGVRAYVRTGNETQMQELTLSRGFQSSVAPKMHFGLGKNQKIDEIKIVWPDRLEEVIRGVDVNQSLNFDHKNAKPGIMRPMVKPTLFVTQKDSLKFPRSYSFENYYDDYVEQVLLPHSMSQFGPVLAKGDLNGDGLEDFIAGGAKGYPSRAFVQTEQGFKALVIPAFEQDKGHEDAGISIVDFNQDGREDIFISSGGNEAPEGDEYFSNRVYLQNDNGDFIKQENVFPEYNVPSSKVFHLDFDGDGDQDLLVTTRAKAHQYPKPVSSYLFENIGSKTILKFKDVSSEKAQDLEKIGMVTDVALEDLNGDEIKDLIIVGEWMPITILVSENGKYVNKTAEYGLSDKTRAWWWSIEKGDFDKDGDIDFVIGNNGLNYKYKAKPEETFDVFVNDFDSNEQDDIVLSYYNDGTQFPVRGRECSSQQIPAIKSKFQNYETFSEATLVDIYTEEDLNKALHYQVESFASVYMEQTENGFVLHNLPQEAQTSSINDILVRDFDKDGNLDVVMVGNLYQSEVETPRNDASIGWYLKGDGKGDFKAIPARDSGFYVPGDSKSMIEVQLNDTPIIIIGKNQDYLQYLRY